MATRSDVLKLTISVEGKEAEAALKRFERGVDRTTTKANEGTAKAARGFGDLRASMLAIGAGVAAVTGAIYAIDRLANQAQRVTNLAHGFDTLTRSHNLSAQTMLNKMRPASRGLITDMELMQQANSALLLGLPVTEQTMGELTEAAVKLGRAMGVDANRSLESMIVGIGRQSRLWLDNLGIIVDTDAAYRKYADTLGVTVDQLTDAQRKQAFFNETMEQARRKSAELGEQVDTLADKWNRLKTSIANATNEAINFINQVPGQGSGGLAAALALAIPGLAQGLQGLDFLARNTDTANLGLSFLMRGSGGGGSAATNVGTFNAAGGSSGPVGYDREAEFQASKEAMIAAKEAYLAIYNQNNMTRPDYTDPEGSPDIMADLQPFMLLGDPDTARNQLDMLIEARDRVEDFQNAFSNALPVTFAFAQAWQASVTALVEGSMSGGEAIRNLTKTVLDSIAAEALGKAAIELAAGFAALATYQYSAAKDHFTAAALYGAVGTAVSAGGALIGRGGGGGGGVPLGGGSSSSVASPSRPAAPPTTEQNVTVVIEGQGIIYATADEVARLVSEAIKRQDSRAGNG